MDFVFRVTMNATAIRSQITASILNRQAVHFGAILAWLLVAAPARSQPLIRTQPADAITSLGGTVQLRVIAQSTNSPVQYQWWFQEAALDTAHNSSASRALLSLPNVTLANAGPYFVIVSDSSGSATS